MCNTLRSSTDNGATYVAPASWQWEKDRQANNNDFLRVIMDSGDALLFRGDLVHFGGANNSRAKRRAISVSYCAGWLRPVENSFLNLRRSTVASLDPKLQAVLGYAAHDATRIGGGVVGLFENGDPKRALEQADAS